MGADDEIVKVGEAPDRMTIAEINALLYLPHHPAEQLGPRPAPGGTLSGLAHVL